MLKFHHVSVHFGQHHVQAVNDVSLEVKSGEKRLIIGETGSGKSVLLLSVLRLLPLTAQVSGSISFEGGDLLSLSEREMERLRGRVIGYVPQGGGNSLNPLLRVGEQVAEPMILHNGLPPMDALRRAVELLDRFKIEAPEQLARQYPHQFSGGMRQRAMIAMGIASGARLLLADEPTKGLDRENMEGVGQAFLQLRDTTLLCVSHDLRFAKQIASYITVMYAGQLVESASAEEFFTAPLHPYSAALVAALPENGMQSLVGFAPANTGDASPGCRFSARCSQKTHKCDVSPPMCETEGGRKVRCWLYE
jgi:peptide/nickel transport system ATP-binding protein